MYQHNTIVSGFILVNDGSTDAALFEARHQIGDPDWKTGYSEDKCKITRALFKKHAAQWLTKLSGPFTGLTTTETKDNSGNVYQKVRVHIGKDILSLDLGTEFCERLLPKLEAAITNGRPGIQIAVSAFPTTVERNGRVFVNHVASVKDADGVEIKGESHFRAAQDASATAVSAMEKAGVKAKPALQAARKAAKEQYFLELAERIAGLFPASEVASPDPRFIKAMQRISVVDESCLEAAQQWVNTHFTGDELRALSEAIASRRTAVAA
jgi:hypothetical protein